LNYRLLSRVFGALLLLITIGMAACLGYAYWDQSKGVENHGAQALLWSTCITGLAGLALFLVGGRSGNQLLRKEAIVVVGLGWFVCSVFAMIPYLFCEPGLGFAPALFEAVSGLTTTGSTVIGNLQSFPDSILLWRNVTQFFGGVGILVLFVALLSYLGSGGKTLFRAESSARVGEGTATRIRQLALRLLGVYLALTTVALLGLHFLGLSWFDAVCHAMTSVATGGFSNYDASIAHFRTVPGINAVALESFLTLIMAAGATSFFIYLAVVQRRWSRLRNAEESRWFLIVLVVATALVTVNLTFERDATRSFPEALLEALFNVVSISTTTGYATSDFSAWPGFSVALIFTLMFIGGCSGSTAGGIKIARVLLFLKVARQEVIAAFRPRQVLRIRLNKAPAEDSARAAVLFACLYAACLFIGTLTVALLEPNEDFHTCFSATAATLFNIGPGISDVGPTENFSIFGSPSLLFMCLLMVMGRLELFAVLALFVPSLWKKY